MSLGSVLSIARSALAAQQTVMQTAAHNIANANTDGYSAQRVELSPLTPVSFPGYTVGTGVGVADIATHRDALLDATYRDENATSAGWDTRSSLLGGIESIIGEPSDSGFASVLDQFFSAWGDLADHPTSEPAQTGVREQGAQLASELNSRADRLIQLGDTAQLQAKDQVTQLNDLLARAADLNQKLAAATAGGKSAGDLSDALGKTLDAISKIVPIQSLPQPNGEVIVSADGIALVNGAAAQTLQLQSLPGGKWGLATGSGISIAQMGGSLGAALQVVNTDVPDAIAKLDRFAQALVSGVNDVMEKGVNADGETGLHFFDDRGDVTTVTASNIALSSDIDDSRKIPSASGAVDGSGTLIDPPVYRPGSNDVALQLAQLRSTTDPARLDGQTFVGYLSNVVADIGLSSASAKQNADIHATLAEQAQTRRSSVSGVSTDEELTHLIQAQSAYAAASKVVTTADQMMQDLLNMVQ